MKHAYWWVNHKQTFKAELEGGYIWSPQRNKSGAYNQTYENLTKVRPGDVIISYASGVIKAIGIASGSAEEQGKPEEFGKKVGQNWSEHEGWLVPVEWVSLTSPLSPKAFIEQLAPLLPEKHSPLQVTGNGNQGCYLASVSLQLGRLVLHLARKSDAGSIDALEALIEDAEADEEVEKILSSSLQLTEKEQLIKARRGQGLFKLRVMALANRCLVTGVEDQRFLVASHIKPWKHSSDLERLDGHNGLLLAPHIDRLFDKGWISFTDTGSLLSTDEALTVLASWHVDPAVSVGQFTPTQAAYLSFHRSHVYKGQTTSGISETPQNPAPLQKKVSTQG